MSSPVLPARRGAVPPLRSAHPLADLLPGIYLEDPLVVGLTEGLDPMLAPVHLTLDCLDAYLDPRLTPLDFLPWLASWVAMEVDETLPPERRRAIVAAAAGLHHVHGTAAGLVHMLELVTGGRVELRESGGTTWSAVPGAEPPGSADSGLNVIVHVADPGPVVQQRVERVVRELRPAHLPFRVQLVAARR